MTPQEMIDWYRAIEFKERGKLELDEQDIATLMVMFKNQEKEALMADYDRLKRVFSVLLEIEVCNKFSSPELQEEYRKNWFNEAGL